MSDLIKRSDAIRQMALMLEDISEDLSEQIIQRFGYDSAEELATEAMSIIPFANEEVMIPKSYHDKVCEEMARRHQAEILELTKDRPQGEWIDAEIPLESGGSMPIQACNLCKTFYPLAYTGGGHRFCPNCGARMIDEDINVPNKEGADDE